MIELLIAVLILCVIAYAAHTFIGGPMGQFVAFVCGALILVLLIVFVADIAGTHHHCC
jgi:hypothetical protein